MNYNRDIGHCPGKGCPLHDKCVRYQLGVMPEAKVQKYTWWVSEDYDAETNVCRNMLPMRQ